MTTTKAKHTMPFCSTAVRAKNVGITVSCVECEKSRLLFYAKKLSEKDRIMLQGFLDTIFFTCGMSFHNTCDLAMAVLPKQPDDSDWRHPCRLHPQQRADVHRRGGRVRDLRLVSVARYREHEQPERHHTDRGYHPHGRPEVRSVVKRQSQEATRREPDGGTSRPKSHLPLGQLIY